MKRYNKLFLTFCFLLLNFGMFSCVDDGIDPDGWDKNLPEELKEGYSITFRMSLDPMGGGEFRTRAASDMKDVEDFVDLEKVRVFFFTCQYDEDGEDEYIENGKTYDSGVHDYFLFESSSRWVSEMHSTSFNASKLWQITTPVFPYGNQDSEYNWDKIREALTTHKFKIVVLANRPPEQPFPDYDNLQLANDKFDNKGPYWTYEDSWANNTDITKVPTINDLHHCQNDPVYASKNNILGINGGNNSTLNESNGCNVYDFIIKNPSQTLTQDVIDGITVNMMGTVSQWSENPYTGLNTVADPKRSTRTNFTANSKSSSGNYALHPKRNDESVGGIPMYGVQKFEPLTNWANGTPFNVSENQLGQDNSYFGKTISLLRSVVRLDLLIPKKYTYDNTTYEITLKDVCLRYPNVTARVTPLDVATPTDLLWSNDNCDETTRECEWYRLQARGPIINGDLGEAKFGAGQDISKVKSAMEGRMGWYYGAWRKWWHFNQNKSDNEVADDSFTGTGIDPLNDSFFGSGPYPHIFNPCVQRNSLVWLDGNEYFKDTDPTKAEKYNVLVPDATYYHYVVYTGERNINDPSNFRKLTILESKICFFQFTIVYNDGNTNKEKTYQVALTDYSKNSMFNTNESKYLKSFSTDTNVKYDWDLENGSNSYRTLMATASYDNWSWLLLRNHIYRFQVTSFGNLKDEDGVDGLVISTEERKSPDITYN